MTLNAVRFVIATVLLKSLSPVDIFLNLLQIMSDAMGNWENGIFFLPNAYRHRFFYLPQYLCSILMVFNVYTLAFIKFFTSSIWCYLPRSRIQTKDMRKYTENLSPGFISGSVKTVPGEKSEHTKY